MDIAVVKHIDIRKDTALLPAVHGAADYYLLYMLGDLGALKQGTAHLPLKKNKAALICAAADTQVLAAAGSRLPALIEVQFSVIPSDSVDWIPACGIDSIELLCNESIPIRGLENAQVLYGLLMQILSEQYTEEAHYERICSELLTAVLQEFLHLLLERKPRPEDYVMLVQAHIHTAFLDELREEELAETLGISLSYLQKLYRKHTGERMTQTLHRLRIQKAMELLREKQNLIVDVAFACGYNNRQHFNAMFRKYAGLTPTQFRKVHTSVNDFPNESKKQTL